MTVSISTTNGSLPGTGAEASPSIPISITTMIHQVSCTTTGLPCDPADGENPPLFNITSATGTGAAGTACAGVVFTISSTGNPGEYAFSPPPGSVVLEIGQSCAVTFTVDVVGLPTIDVSASAGLQTRQTNQVLGIVVGADNPDLDGLDVEGLGPDTTTIEASCDVKLDKQISCNNGEDWVSEDFVTGNDVTGFCQGWYDTEDAGGPGVDFTNILVRYRFQNLSSPGVELQSCSIVDDNAEILSVDASSIVLGDNETSSFLTTDPMACSDLLDDGEPNTATLTCDCALNEQVFTTATDFDTEEFACDTCAVDVDKQVACDDGVFGDFCITWAEGPFNDAESVTVKYEAENIGTVGVICTPSGAFPGDGLTETNSLLNQPTQNLAGLTEFSQEVATLCSDPLDDQEPDTATLNCACLDRNGDPTELRASASDTSEFACQSPNLTITKLCEPQVEGSNDVSILVTNEGDASLANCVVTDEYFTGTECPAGPEGSGTALALDNDGPFSLPLNGDENTSTGFIAGLTENACNTTSVTCEIVGSDDGTGAAKTITVGTDATCQVQGDECITRTPGFWGTHPHITSQFLNLESCGIEINNVSASTQGSATEDMCSVGTDPKAYNAFPQQIQLERQCMAAVLNVAASADVLDSSCDLAYPGIGDVIGDCCINPGSICTSSLEPGELGVDGRTINSCIGLLDAFNNNDAAEPLETPFPFASPGPADPSMCQASKNNGFLNARPREAAVVAPVAPKKKK